jgi:hypothetical protein
VWKETRALRAALVMMMMMMMVMVMMMMTMMIMMMMMMMMTHQVLVVAVGGLDAGVEGDQGAEGGARAAGVRRLGARPGLQRGHLAGRSKQEKGLGVRVTSISGWSL